MARRAVTSQGYFRVRLVVRCTPGRWIHNAPRFIQCLNRNKRHFRAELLRLGCTDVPRDSDFLAG